MPSDKCKKKQDFCFEEYPAIICGICGQTPLFVEFRVEAEALTDDLCIQLGMGEDKMGKFHLAVESSSPAGLEKA